MSLQLPYSIKVLNPIALDYYYSDEGTPYASVAAANTACPSAIRYIGLTVIVGTVEYWYQGGITDPDLVVKSGGDRMVFPEISSPATPAADTGVLYGENGTFGAENDTVLKFKDENDNVFRVSHRRFIHVQGTAVQVWTIDHNMGEEPNITVYDDASPQIR